MKKHLYLIGLSAAILGAIVQTFFAYYYDWTVVIFGDIVIVAGMALAVYDRKAKGMKLGMPLICGCVGMIIGIAVNRLYRYIYIPSIVSMLFYIASILLLAYCLIKDVIGIDLKSLANIKKNGNKKFVVLHSFVVLLGFAVLLTGVFEALAFFILLGLAIIAFGVFNIVKYLKQPDIREDELYMEQDESMNAELRKLQSILLILRVLMFICYAVAFVFVIFAIVNSTFPTGLIVMVIVCGIITMVQDHFTKKMKTYVSDNITKQALSDVFDIAEYNPFGHIDSSKITGAYFGIGSFDNLEGSDYVRGTYKGLPIEFCDMHLTERHTRTNEDGREEEYYETVFRGLWLICDFGKELSASMRLWERDKLGKLVGGKGIATENERFNKNFHIESDVEVEAFYILTPHMMEYILEMDKKADGQTHMRFDRGGKVQIAIGTNRDSFEVSKNVKDATLLRKQFVREIRYITDIIDELRLVDTLYKK